MLSLETAMLLVWRWATAARPTTAKANFEIVIPFMMPSG
jgi:hypothetical protein